MSALGCHPYWFSWDSFLLGPGSANSGRLAAFASLSSGVTSVYHHTWPFMWLLGILRRSLWLHGKHFSEGFIYCLNILSAHMCVRPSIPGVCRGQKMCQIPWSWSYKGLSATTWVGTGNWTHILCKNRKYSQLLSPLSNPTLSCFQKQTTTTVKTDPTLCCQLALNSGFFTSASQGMGLQVYDTVYCLKACSSTNSHLLCLPRKKNSHLY